MLGDGAAVGGGGGELDGVEEDVEVLAGEFAPEGEGLGDAGGFVLVVAERERGLELVERARGVVTRGVGIDAEGPRPELEDVATSERGGLLRGEAPAVEPGAVAAGEVADEPVLLAEGDGGVLA